LPVGAWLCSFVFDVASQVIHRPGFLALGSEWLIAIGVLGAVVAAGAGFIDLTAIDPDTAEFRTARAHMSINVLLIFAYVANFAWRYRSHPAGAPVGAAMLALSAGCVITLAVSCYLGGKLAHRHGASVLAQADVERRDRNAA
jgi:uncharacterized membrane protein